MDYLLIEAYLMTHLPALHSWENYLLEVSPIEKSVLWLYAATRRLCEFQNRMIVNTGIRLAQIMNMIEKAIFDHQRIISAVK